MKTKPLTFLLALTFLFLFSGSVFADDYQDGLDAIERKDYKEAYRLILPLAEKGNAEAQSMLGVMLMYSIKDGVTQDYKEAFKWNKLAAEQGIADAQGMLGLMYGNGYGVSQDYKESVKWYRLSAEQGNASAQYNMGFMHDLGKGVRQDYKESVKWWRLAAEQGFAKATLIGFDVCHGTRSDQRLCISTYVVEHLWY